MKALNIPNTLTIARIVIIPLFITTIIYEKYDYALYLFLTAAATDSLDGLIARLTNQRTAFGTFLDPLADKFLLVTSFVLFSVYGWIPKWLTVIVISRDVIIIIGWVILYILTHITKVEPSLFGKGAIAMQLVLICYVLLEINMPSLPDTPGLLLWGTALLAIFSCLHYIYRGLKLTNA